jgi:hypothetical protein
MNKLYVESRSYTYSTGGYDPSDKWSRDSTSTDWEFGSVKPVRGGAVYDITIDWDGEVDKGTKVFVTVAVWNTGDSFGNDDGYYAEAFSVHTEYDKAVKAREILEKAEGVLDVSDKPYDLGDGYKLHYAPWKGYFESLGRIEIVEGFV